MSLEPEILSPYVPKPRRFPALVALLSALCAGWGGWIVMAHPGAGLKCFIAAGLLLAFSMTMIEADADGSGLAKPRQSWELKAFLLLLALAFCLRLTWLDSVPAGAVTYEGEMFADILHIQAGPYTPHSTHSVNRWPTLFHYQSLFFSKIFGWNLGAMRIPAGIWSLLSIATFYFLVRRLTSPFTAALSTLFYIASYHDIILARRVFPGTNVHFPILAAWLFLLKDREKPGMGFAAMAGFCAGIALHSYYPGRGVPFIFGGWFVWLYLFQPEKLPTGRSFAWFWAILLVTASPVLWWAARNWTFYWGWVQGMNPHRGEGFSSYLRAFFDGLGPYLRQFHVAGDAHWEDNVGGLPLLDPITGALFGAAFFFVLARFWDPTHILALAIFLTGMAPAVLSSGFPAPSTRREVMMIPGLYLIFALGLEQWRLAWWAYFRKTGRAFAVIGLCVLGMIALKMNFQRVFKTYYRNPDILAAYNHGSWLARQELRRYPGHHAVVNQFLMDSWSSAAFFDPKRSVSRFRSVDELMVLDPAQDHLLLLDPFLEHAEHFMADLYPGMTMKVFSLDKDHLASRPMDPFDESAYLTEMVVPKEAAARAHGFLTSGVSGTARVAAFERGFSEGHAGQALQLKGTLMLLNAAQGDLAFGMGWPGWDLEVDGRRAAWDRPMKLDLGAHWISLKGRVQAGAHGPMPFHVLSQGRDLAAMQVLALDPEHGWNAEYFTGSDPSDLSKRAFRRIELAPLRRYWDPLELSYPFSARFKAHFKVPADGTYALRMRVPPAMGRITVDGHVLFDNLWHESAPVYGTAVLGAGDGHILTVEYQANPMAVNRTILIEVKGPGDKAFKPMTREWIKPLW